MASAGEGGGDQVQEDIRARWSSVCVVHRDSTGQNHWGWSPKSHTGRKGGIKNRWGRGLGKVLRRIWGPHEDMEGTRERCSSGLPVGFPCGETHYRSLS